MVHSCLNNNTIVWKKGVYKKCSNCHRYSFLCNFGFTSKQKTHLKSKCKICYKEYNKINSKKYIQQRKIRYQNDEEYRNKVLQQSKKSNLKNKDKIREYNKEYYLKNKDKIQKRNKEYYLKDYKENPEKYKQRHYDYVKQDPENYRQIRLKYKRTHKGKLTQKILDNNRRELKVKVNENYTKQDIEYTFNLFNNKCFNCSSTENLSIDHHMPLSKGYGLTRSNAVVLCRKCNSKKGNKLPSEYYSNDQINELNLKLKTLSN